MQHPSPQGLRIVPGADGVAIWSHALFGADVAGLRELLVRAFSVTEVEGVELRRAQGFGRIRYGAVQQPASIWRKLSRALRGETPKHNGSPVPRPAPRLDASALFLDGPRAGELRVSRVDNALTTWRVLRQTDDSLQLWHPLLRGPSRNSELLFRLEEELAALYGVQDFRTNPWRGALSVRFDAHVSSAARVAQALETAWPRLLEGLPPPPSRTRFFTATGLLGLAFTGQYLVPAVRPVAVLGAALYSSPNALAAAKDLTRGQVGLPALYTTGLAFMLVSGMPFASTLFATLGQLWPNLARRRLIRSQRRLFAAHRRRPEWARLAQRDGEHGSELEIRVAALRGGEQVRVRRGELVPVDGVVVAGLAAAVTPVALGSRIVDLAPGDAVSAGSALRDGELTLRVERAGQQSVASYIDGLLPHAYLPDTPAALEVERIGNRNARPALALAAASLLATRTLRLSQAAIRPDYVTAPRLSAQLSALQGLAHGLQQGIVLKSPAALDQLASAEVFVLDDSADLERASLVLAEAAATSGMSEAQVLQHALSARVHEHSEWSRALGSAAAARGIAALPTPVSRQAGVSRFRDADGSQIEVATLAYLQRASSRIPRPLQAHVNEPGSLWVLRNGAVVGVVSFARRGEPVGVSLVQALRAHDPRARIIYLSAAQDADVQVLGASLGVDVAYGGLSPASKAQLFKSSPRRALWVGDGSNPQAREAIAASTVSASLAPLERVRSDAADILLPADGLWQLPAALALGRAHAGRLSRDYRAVYAVNLLGLFGAFGARLTSLQVGLLSNAATYWIYARQARELERLAVEAEATRERRQRALHP